MTVSSPCADMNSPHTKTYTMTRIALLTSMSLTLFLLEGFLPLPFLAPGVKLGLSNIVTVFALYLLSFRAALTVLGLRLVLAALFAGSPAVLFYSISGGVLALLTMEICRRTNSFSLLGVSMAGGFFHNLGQLIVAALMMDTLGIFSYLPILGPVGLATGFLIGSISHFLLARFPSP